MGKISKGKWVYISILIISCAIIITTVWAFGERLFFKEEHQKEKGTVTVYKTEENYYNKNFKSLVKNGELHIADCGAVADSHFDYGDLLRSAINTCLETGAKLVLEKGTYYCSPEEGSQYLVDLSSTFADGFTLEGNGAKIINTDAFSGFFKFSESTNISISGLNLDYFILPWVQGEVVFYNEDTNEITIMTDESHTVFDDPRYLNSVTDIFGVVRNSEDVRKIDVDRTHFFRISTVKKVEDKGYVVKLGTNMKFSLGDRVTINNRINAAYNVFDIRTCGNVNLKDINVYASAGCLILGQYMTGDVVLDNVNILFGDDNRWITTNGDGVHIQANSGKLVMKNCTFEGLTDDCINLYQRAVVIPEMVSNNTFILNGTATGTRVTQKVGETLIFYNPNTGETVGEAKVTKIENVEGKSTAYVAKVTVDKQINGIIIGSELENATNVYIKEQGHNGSTITNCTFRYIRAGGVCLRANDVTVEGNTFEHISNRAVHVAVWSSEGSAVDGVKILNNTVTDCAYHNDYTNTFMAGAINVFMLNYARTAQVPNTIHQNVVVKGNTINGWHGRAMWIANSKNVEIVDNIFNGDDKLGVYDIKETMYINECENVKVSGNEFHDNTSEYSGSIVYDSKTVKGIQFSDNTFDIEKDKQIVVK